MPCIAGYTDFQVKIIHIKLVAMFTTSWHAVSYSFMPTFSYVFTTVTSLPSNKHVLYSYI